MNTERPEWHSMAVAPLPIGNYKRCKCSVCNNTFSSTSAFDKHRVGAHGTPERRCVDPRSIGMRIRTVTGGTEFAFPSDPRAWGAR